MSNQFNECPEDDKQRQNVRALHAQLDRWEKRVDNIFYSGCILAGILMIRHTMNQADAKELAGRNQIEEFTWQLTVEWKIHFQEMISNGEMQKLLDLANEFGEEAVLKELKAILSVETSKGLEIAE